MNSCKESYGAEWFFSVLFVLFVHETTEDLQEKSYWKTLREKKTYNKEVNSVYDANF